MTTQTDLTDEQLQAALGLFGRAPSPAPTRAQMAGLQLPWEAGGALAPPGAPPVEPPAMAPAPAPAPPAPAPAAPAPMTAPAPSAPKPGRPSSEPAAGGMGRLAAQARADQQALLGTYDDQAAAQRALGDAQAAQGDARARHMAGEADRQAAHAQVQIEEYRRADELHQGYLARTQQMLDDLASERVDPQRLFAKASTGERMTYALGGILGGILAGLDGGENQFLRTIDALKREDVAAQEANIANRRSAIQARQSVYAQMRDSLQSKQAAEAAYGLALTQAAEQQLGSMMSSTGARIDQERAHAAMAQIAQAKQVYATQLSQESLKTAQAQAGAAAAAQRAGIEKMLAARAAAFEKAIGAGYSPDQAAVISEYMIGAAPPRALAGMVPEADLAKEAAKAGGGEARKQTGGLISDLEGLRKAWSAAEADLPMSGATETIRRTGSTDTQSRYVAATNAIVGMLKRPGMNSDADLEMLRTQAPKAGDDAQTLAQKRALAVQAVVSKYPDAAQRIIREDPAMAVRLGLLPPEAVAPGFTRGGGTR